MLGVGLTNQAEGIRTLNRLGADESIWGKPSGGTSSILVGKPLMIVLGLGAFLRLALLVGLSPTTLAQPDPWLYVHAADTGIFSDQIHPAGYAILLRTLRPLTPDPIVVVVLQHALGLLGAGLLYAVARRLQASPLWSCLPAGVVALSLDQVLIEHTLISDSTFVFFVILTVYAFVRWRDEHPDRPGGLAIVGALAACTMLLRGAAPVLLLFVVLAAAFARPTSVARSIIRVLSVVGGLVLVMVPYLAAQHSVTGRWALTEASGWSLYTRVAPFARCEVAHPPADTRFLCEESRPSERGGPDFYGWVGGPARARFGTFSEGNDELNRFSQAVLRSQFGDYIVEVSTDFLRYFSSVDARHAHDDGRGGSAIRIDAKWEPTERNTRLVLEDYYGEITPVRRDRIVDIMADTQGLLRISRYPLLGVSFLAILGIALLPARRRAIGFLMLVGSGSLLFSVAVAPYNWRYALPWIPLFFLAGALGGDGLARRQRGKIRAARS